MDNLAILAFDTSNYTTSVAMLSQEESVSLGKLLSVPEGQLGLRQQEALFQHVKTLPFLMEELRSLFPLDSLNTLSAVAVSTKPRETEDSYMPCFLAGETMGKSIATLLGVPCFEVSHQQGHFAAAVWAMGKEELLDAPFLVWHISGGTTELLLVKPEGILTKGEIIGGTSDISAGQLIDRTGNRLKMPFPSGKQVDALSVKGAGTLKPFSVKIQDLFFSLSGMENKVNGYVEQGEDPEEICQFVMDTIGKTLKEATKQARKSYGEELPVVFCGGVAASSCLRKWIPEGLFPPPKYATDNAMGVAVLGKILLQAEGKATKTYQWKK